MIQAKLIHEYLNYVNNYYSVEYYATINEMSIDDAQKILDLGKHFHEISVKMFKESGGKNDVYNVFDND